MMKKAILAGMLFTVIFFMTSGMGISAEVGQLPIQLNKKPVKAPVKVSSPTPSFTTARPLVTEIKVSPARINSSAILLTVPYEELRKAMEHLKGAYFGWDYIDGVTDWLEKNCAGKSYTVDQQKAAGCLGTDTVDACTEKLYQHCFQSSPYMDPYKRELREMIEAMDALNKAAALYENGLKQAEKKVQQP
jgi:hypothetical protein